MRAEAYYRQLLDVSQRMLASGMAQQWDELVLLDEQRRELLSNPPQVFPDESTQLLIESIRQVQVCDAQLLGKVEDWMTSARVLLRMDNRRTPEV